MEIENLNTKELKIYEKNARVHSKKQIDLLAKNIKEFGFTTPILIDSKNNVIAGHGRLLALKQLGKNEAPCVRMDNLNDAQVKALRLADNQLASMAEWDMGLAIDELKELSEEMFDLTGFDKDLLIEPDEKDDIIPENVPSKAKLGEIYQLGNHRIMVGDSTKKEDVEKLMDGKKADIFLTDPPYNVNYEGKTKERMSAVKKGKVPKNHWKKGKLHPFWIKDRSKIELLSTTEYKLFRLRILKRDNYQCQECGIRGKRGIRPKLQVDHIKSRMLHPELSLDEKNVRTLCLPCHKKTDSYLNRWQQKDYTSQKAEKVV